MSECVWWNPLTWGKAKWYATWQDASIATQKLGITSCMEYAKKHRKDKHLPESPHKHYGDFPGWSAFFSYKK